MRESSTLTDPVTWALQNTAVGWGISLKDLGDSSRKVRVSLDFSGNPSVSLKPTNLPGKPAQGLEREGRVTERSSMKFYLADINVCSGLRMETGWEWGHCLSLWWWWPGTQTMRQPLGHCEHCTCVLGEMPVFLDIVMSCYCKEKKKNFRLENCYYLSFPWKPVWLSVWNQFVHA